MMASGHWRYAQAAFVLAIIAGCATTIETGAHFDEAADFGAYETFSWIAERPYIGGDPAVRPTPAVETAIDSAIRHQLEKRGYRFVRDRDSADFVVAYTIGAREQIRPEDYPSDFRGFMSWHVPGSLQAVHDPYPHTYTEGTLSVDLFDRASGRPVWHGWAQKTITPADRRDPEASVSRGLDRIFREFPRALQ